MNTFLKGALLLIIAAFIGECIEFLVNIVLARELGEEGLGLYMSILPTIVFIESSLAFQSFLLVLKPP